MSDARADALLKSALEKIVYFEARSEQVQSDLASARAEAERFKNELAAAAQREIALRRQIAELEVTVQRGHKEREELSRINEALRAERTGWMDKLLDSARIQATGSDSDGLDLASFIATLRQEVIAGRGPAPVLTPPPAPVYVAEAAPPPPRAEEPRAEGLQGEAERYLRQGRLAATEAEVLALAQPKGATERTLFGFSVRELSNPDAGSRLRAAERLKALGDRAAAPALATALHSERDAKVLVALVNAFAALATKEGAELVAPLLTGQDPEVRIAALKALLALDPERAAPHLSAASRDPDPWVRRRASLLALGRPGEEALKLSEESAHDQDVDVRRLSTLALGAAGRDKARAQLLEALGDPAPAVRSAAASSLGRMLGQDVRYVLALDPAQRRREVRKLALLPARRHLAAGVAQVGHLAAGAVPGDHSGPGVAQMGHMATRVVPGNQNHLTCGSGLPTATADASRFETVFARVSTVSRGPSTGSGETAPTGQVHTGQMHTGQVHTAQLSSAQVSSVHLPSAPPPSAPVPAAASEALTQPLLLELRTAIRGRALEDLARSGLGDLAGIEAGLTLLIARGQVVRRGSKFFVA